eukprot:Skav232033  [mRNA]  locus=scaffold2323:116661:120638:+ [translate_table: standard]
MLSSSMQVAFVKKIYSDGIQKDNLTERIDRIITADERDHSSEGVILARKHEVTRAPFFVVTDDAKPEEGPTILGFWGRSTTLNRREEEKIYDVYFKLKKDVFDQESGEAEKNEEIIRGQRVMLVTVGKAPGHSKQRWYVCILDISLRCVLLCFSLF